VRESTLRRAVICGLAATLLGGCLLVAPLDDDTYGGGAGKPSGGSAGHGGAGLSGGGGTGLNGGEGGSEAGQGGVSETGGTHAGTGGASHGGMPGAAGQVEEPGGTSGTGARPTLDDPCSSNADCVSRSGNGAPYHCTTDGKCVALRSSECPLVYDSDAVKSDNPIYIGAFAPLPPATPDMSSGLYPFRLALGEINGAYGGLVMPNHERRPLVIIACDNCAAGTCGASGIDDAAAHLIDDVGVNAVLATLEPSDLRRVFENHRDKGVFMLSPLGATSVLTSSFDDNDLVWTMLGQPSDLSVVYRDLITQRVEPYLRNVRGIGSRPIRVALLRGTDAFSLELSSLVADEIVWNGKSAADNGDNYQGFTLDSQSLDSVVTQLLAFEPDLVISTAADEVTRRDSGIVWQLETKWTGLVADNQPLPFWILSPYNAGSLGDVMHLLETEMTGADASPTSRFVGITAASAPDGKLQSLYAVNVKDAFPDADPDTGNFYDAFYFLAYSIYAAHQNDPGGTDIASGMHRLLSGDSYDVGLADIAHVTSALKDATSTISLNGTLGPPAFDSDGIHIDPGSVYCFEASGGGVVLYSDALRYDRTAQSFSGTFACFTGFDP
jgi:hypothetical protein